MFKYYLSWPSTIPHSATRYFGGGGEGGKQTIFIEYDVGQKKAHKHMLKTLGQWRNY
jgi:hypothetical protein